MLFMTAFTVLYEYQRQRWSLAAIIVLLCGIFGVIFIPEKKSHTHYIFAAAALFAIVGFMVGHSFCDTSIDIHDNLRMLLYVQILFMVITVIGVIQDAPIFAIEALFLLNFAIFYVYLHYTGASMVSSSLSASLLVRDDNIRTLSDSASVSIPTASIATSRPLLA